MSLSKCVLTRDIGCIYATFNLDERVWSCPYMLQTGDCELDTRTSSRRYVK